MFNFKAIFSGPSCTVDHDEEMGDAGDTPIPAQFDSAPTFVYPVLQSNEVQRQPATLNTGTPRGLSIGNRLTIRLRCVLSLPSLLPVPSPHPIIQH